MLKGEPFGLCETPVCSKKGKKLKGDHWEIFKEFPKKILKIEIFEQCHSAEKCKNPLVFFDIHCVAKYRNQ